MANTLGVSCISLCMTEITLDFVSNSRLGAPGYSWCLLSKMYQLERYMLIILFVLCAFFSYHFFSFCLLYDMCRKSFEWRC